MPAISDDSKFDILLKKAKKEHMSDNLDVAQKQYKKLLKKKPGNQKVLNLLGGLLLQKKQYEDAIKILKRACAKNNSDPDLPYNLGLAYYHTKRYEDAITSYRESINLDENHDRAYYMQGKAYIALDSKRYRREAFNCYLKDIEITDRLDSHILAAEILQVEEKYIEARGIAKRAIEKDSTNENALFILAKTIISENYDKAQIDIRHVEPIIKIGKLILKINPDSWRAHHIIAEALSIIGENDLALIHYQKVNALKPNFSVSKTNAGVLLLKQGRLKEGWENISSRKDHGVTLYGIDENNYKKCPAKEWQGELLEGKNIFIASEQGIGDQLLHGQMFKELLAAKMNMFVTCTEKIISLMKRSFPTIKFFDSKLDIDIDILKTIDYKADLLDLGKYLRDDISKFKEKFYYLNPDKKLCEYYFEKYKMFGSVKKIGISWKSASKSVGSIKSTELMQWKDILTVPNVKFINIQYGDTANDISEVEDEFGIDIFTDDFNPFNNVEKAVAQISALDLVISVSNASVHFSGQLNIPTWVILNNRPLWHWFENNNKSIWYDSLTLYRQGQIEAWKPVFDRVALDLNNFIVSEQV